MPVKHSRDVSVDDPADCAYLNSDHKITNMLGYELLDSQVLDSGSNLVYFGDLDLDEDSEYLIEFNGTVNPVSSVSYLKVVLNSDPTLIAEGVEHVAISDNAGHGYASMTYLCCGRCIAVQPTKIISKAVLSKKVGEYLYFKSLSDVYGDTYVAQEGHNGVVRSSNNIISVSITPTTGTVLGTFLLWKKLPYSSDE